MTSMLTILPVMYARNERGKTDPAEVIALTNVNYNAYWGYQDGERETNSRVKTIEEPLFILNHYFKVNNKDKGF
jgi:hypothetical protein